MPFLEQFGVLIGDDMRYRDYLLLCDRIDELNKPPRGGRRA